MNKILMRQRIENAQKEIDSKKMIVQNGKMRQHYLGGGDSPLPTMHPSGD